LGRSVVDACRLRVDTRSANWLRPRGTALGVLRARGNGMKLFSIALVASIISLAPPVLASPHDDLAFAVQESNHDKTSGWIIERLVTLDIGDACWAKVLDHKNGALSKLASDARYIERFAKALTGDEWSALENQGANNRDANRALVDKMITEFVPKFHLTIRLDGKDCDAGSSALWLKYASITTIALSKYPPKAGRLHVTIDVTSAKGLRAEMNKDGSELVITGSRDIESENWSDTIEKTLKRASTKN
jgi:hypothetical protein